MFKFLLFSLLFSTFSLAKGTPRLDDLESKLSVSEKSIMKQEFTAQNLQTKIDELKTEIQKLKDTQYNYRIEKNSYDYKMENNTNLISSQNDRISDINTYFGVASVFWGLFITIILIVVFFRAKKESIEGAREEAQKIIDEWIQNKASDVVDKKIADVLIKKDEEINNLIKKQIENKVNPKIEKIKASMKDVEALVEILEQQKNTAESHLKSIENTKAKIELPPPSEEKVEKIEEKEDSSLTAQEYYQVALDAYYKNKFNTALNEIENSIKLSDNDSDELLNSFVLKGAVLDALKEYNQAIEAYKKAIEINPKKNEFYYNIGIAYGNKGEYDQAIEAYKKAIEINPKMDEAYNNMGNAYYNKGEYDQAIEAYKKAIEINPKKDEAYYNLGIAYGNKGEYDQEIEAYKKAIEINPKKDEAYYNLGIAYGNKGEYDQEIEAYKKAIEINPKRDKAYYNLGIAYSNKGEYDQAIEAYKKAIEINPKKNQAYYNMGIAYSNKGEYDQAIEAFQKALQINPNDSSTYTNLFELQLTQQQPVDEVLEQKYIELFEEEKESFILYEMLKIVQNIFNKKEVNLEEWREKYEGVSLGDWSFDELNNWVDGVEDVAIQEKLKEAIEVFEGHI